MESISYFKTISVRDFHFDDNDYIFIKEDLPMGQADVNVNLWLKDTKRFADLFNAILFHGETVILPENLHPSPETTAVSLQDAQGKNVVKKQYRDIIMNWQDQAVLMLLAVESQTSITESKSMVSTSSSCCLRVYSSRLSI